MRVLFTLVFGILFYASALASVDVIIVNKSKNTLQLVNHKKQVVREFPVAFGANPVGHKRFEGDNKTPEGQYKISFKNPKSSYHKSLVISYPNKQDIEHAKKFGKSAGGAISIHGEGERLSKVHKRKNWTRGCIGMTNKQIDEIYKLVPLGAKIIINP